MNFKLSHVNSERAHQIDDVASERDDWIGEQIVYLSWDEAGYVDSKYFSCNVKK